MAVGSACCCGVIGILVTGRRLLPLGMGNILNRASTQVGQVAMTAVDRVIATRLPQAEALVTRLRTSQPGWSHEQVADAVIKKFAKELAGSGAVSGAIAAAPAVGTAASMATAVADIGLAFARVTEMVMGVGVAFGHDLGDLETRRGWVYQVLSGATGSMTDSEKQAGNMKKQIGRTALAAKSPAATTARVTEIMGTKLIGKLVTKEAVVKLASLIPLGIGAGVGAAGNRALANSIGRTSKAFFNTWGRAELVR